ncbi:hypothetical protein SAMN04487995_3732 [Dyadobacter koreensis]|uniref:Uncharacterized protein n=1 Tax=Dyadobacter koreensis TaxID=408657 RepID=A0A1H6WVX2_9BACT|nr:hypothetical protein [Dyadobacter koreensis]SEJ20006.1 hypothetical protein SAMN04487995_3732 [Dyadobacter koreensis]
MKNNFFIILALTLLNSYAWSQDAYDRQKALNSEELFFKQNVNKVISGNAGQKYLVLDAAPRVGKFRRYRFFPGDVVKFRTRNEKIRFKSAIISISDTSLTIANEATGKMDYREIMLKDIRLFKVSKRIPFVTEASYYFPIAGLLYIGADYVNKGVDDKRFTTDGSAFIVGAALMAAGFVCYKLSFASIPVNNRNKLKVIETY